jgi:oligopeptide transport system substrate-binding protein
MNMYETNEIDITNVDISYIDKVTDEAGPFYQDLKSVSELSFFYIGFNCAKPPFNDVNVRRAFSQAIDKDKLVSLVFREMVQRADGILPPGMPGYNDFAESDFNIAQAKDLIMDSEYGDVSNLPPIVITTSGWGGSISQGLEAIIHEWRQNLGVEVNVRQLEPERFIYHLKQEKDEMFYTGWIADYPHPHSFLDILFRSDADNNYGEYSNPEVDKLLEMACVQLDNQYGLKLYQQVEQMIIDDVACIPLWFGQNYILVKPYVDGYQLNLLGRPTLNSVSVKSH